MLSPTDWENNYISRLLGKAQITTSEQRTINGFSAVDLHYKLTDSSLSSGTSNDNREIVIAGPNKILVHFMLSYDVKLYPQNKDKIDVILDHIVNSLRFVTSNNTTTK